jgi:hypothetical protein
MLNYSNAKEIWTQNALEDDAIHHYFIPLSNLGLIQNLVRLRTLGAVFGMIGK